MIAVLAVLIGLGFTFNIVLKMVTDGVIWVIEWITGFVEKYDNNH